MGASRQSQAAFSARHRSLALPVRLRSRLEACARARYPREACGLLIGWRDRPITRVVDVREARNLAPEGARERFELDPAAHLAAEELARGAGLDVVGIWHSHPDHPAVPSEEDRARAWERWSYVIVSVRAGSACELRAWRPAERGFEEEELRT